MKIVHFSSLRLGAPFPNWPDFGARIRERQRNILSELFKQSRAEGISALLCTGSLFDSNSAPLSEVHAVRDLCFEHPDVCLLVLPGGRDPWDAYSAHRHLASGAPDNLIVMTPGTTEPRMVRPGLWVYGIPMNARAASPTPLSALERGNQPGVHLALVWGDAGRLQPGPEEGLVMVSPEVAGHPFDYLALADDGPAERVGGGSRPACYARALVPDGPDDGSEPFAWMATLGDGPRRVDEWAVPGIRFAEISLDVSRFADMSAVASAIRREADSNTVAHVTLTGKRPAHRPILEPALRARCREDLLALRIDDRTELTAPDTSTAPAFLKALWDGYREADPQTNAEWRDALTLFAAGVTNPQEWKEAPWARS